MLKLFLYYEISFLPYRLERKSRRPESALAGDRLTTNTDLTRRPASAQSDSASSVTSRSSRSDKRRFIRRAPSGDSDVTTRDVTARDVTARDVTARDVTSPRTISVKSADNDINVHDKDNKIKPADDVTEKNSDVKSPAEEISAQLAAIEANLDARARRRRDRKVTSRRSSINQHGASLDTAGMYDVIVTL